MNQGDGLQRDGACGLRGGNRHFFPMISIGKWWDEVNISDPMRGELGQIEFGVFPSAKKGRRIRYHELGQLAVGGKGLSNMKNSLLMVKKWLIFPGVSPTVWAINVLPYCAPKSLVAHLTVQVWMKLQGLYDIIWFVKEMVQVGILPTI